MSELDTTQQKQLSKPAQGMKALLLAKKDAIQAIASRYLSADQIIMAVGLAMLKNPKLQECTHESVLQSAMTAGRTGLDPSGSLGSAYLVPFRNKKSGLLECVFIAGYRGLIDLAHRNNDKIAGVNVWLVYRGENFNVRGGTAPGIDHQPTMDPNHRTDDNVVAAYAVAMVNNHPVFVWMTRKEIDAIRNRSPGKNGDLWVYHYQEACKKTVIRRLMKIVPLSPEAQVQMAEAERVENDLETATDLIAEVDGVQVIDPTQKLKDAVS